MLVKASLGVPVMRLLIRDVEDELVRELERRAQANGRSKEDEVREILRKALDEEDQGPSEASTADHH
jgi:plasmid stability protein